MATCDGDRINIHQRRCEHEIDEDDDDDDDDLQCAVHETSRVENSGGAEEDSERLSEECQDNLAASNEALDEGSKNARENKTGDEQVHFDGPVGPQDESNVFDDGSDAELAYTDDSFCSDDSSGESEAGESTRCSGKHTRAFPADKSSTHTRNVQSRYAESNDDASTRLGSVKRCSSLTEGVRRLAISEKRSVSSCQTRRRRKNMTFTPFELRRIEKENEILVKRIMMQRRPQSRIARDGPLQTRLSSSAINRKRFERKVAHDNMLLLDKIQRAKSCVIPSTSVPGYRKTYI